MANINSTKSTEEGIQEAGSLAEYEAQLGEYFTISQNWGQLRKGTRYTILQELDYSYLLSSGDWNIGESGKEFGCVLKGQDLPGMQVYTKNGNRKCSNQLYM